MADELVQPVAPPPDWVDPPGQQPPQPVVREPYPESTIVAAGFQADHDIVQDATERATALGILRAAKELGLVPGWIYCGHCGRPWYVIPDPPPPQATTRPGEPEGGPEPQPSGSGG